MPLSSPELCPLSSEWGSLFIFHSDLHSLFKFHLLSSRRSWPLLSLPPVIGMLFFCLPLSPWSLEDGLLGFPKPGLAQLCILRSFLRWNVVVSCHRRCLFLINISAREELRVYLGLWCKCMFFFPNYQAISVCLLVVFMGRFPGRWVTLLWSFWLFFDLRPQIYVEWIC